MVSKICVKQIVGAPQNTIMAAIIIFFFFLREKNSLSQKKTKHTHKKKNSWKVISE